MAQQLKLKAICAAILEILHATNTKWNTSTVISKVKTYKYTKCNERFTSTVISKVKTYKYTKCNERFTPTVISKSLDPEERVALISPLERCPGSVSLALKKEMLAFIETRRIYFLTYFQERMC